jgi:hypothetical protein
MQSRSLATEDGPPPVALAEERGHDVRVIGRRNAEALTPLTGSPGGRSNRFTRPEAAVANLERLTEAEFRP